MRFGICIPLEKSPEIKTAGWDFIEESVQGLLQGQTADSDWTGHTRAGGSALPIYSANVMVPASLKITGPQADLESLRQYMARILARAEKIGLKIIVFGSGGARQVPDGFDRRHAASQIVAFGKASAELAARHGVTIVLEPLNRGECNIVNTLGEAMELVRAVDHPNFQCLLDSFHFWTEREDARAIAAAAPWIKHVHVADLIGRVAPGESGQADYRPIFGPLKRAGYAGACSVEALSLPDLALLAPRVLGFLSKQWEDA